jgi:hypothetical protein
MTLKDIKKLLAEIEKGNVLDMKLREFQLQVAQTAALLKIAEELTEFVKLKRREDLHKRLHR